MAVAAVRAVAIKIDENTKARIRRLADACQRTPHWLMREAITQYVDREEKREAFCQDALQAWEAFRATGDAAWSTEAKRAFEWFLGRNDLGLPLYDFTTGGCGDGLHADRVNENQGAESTLAFQLALAEMNSAQHLITHPPLPVTSVASPL